MNNQNECHVSSDLNVTIFEKPLNQPNISNGRPEKNQISDMSKFALFVFGDELNTNISIHSKPANNMHAAPSIEEATFNTLTISS